MINYIKYINICKIFKVHVDVKSKTKIIVCSDTQKEKAEHEWEAAQMPSSSLPTQTNPVQFSTLQSKHFMGSAASTPPLDRGPLTPTSSIECSPLLSTSSSTLTPNLDNMKLGCGRGRPHKELTPVDYSDFPYNALKKEPEKWQKRKNMEKWRYAKKTGSDSHEFRQAESKRSLEYYYKKKGKKAQGGEGNASDEVVDVTEAIETNEVETQDTSDRSKELSRQR